MLGLTGGIAIYKSASLLRRLVNDESADVTVVMTQSAQKFMTPLIFETFSGKPVLTDMFAGIKVATRHIDLAVDSDIILISPATANIVAKAANGIADDLLSTIILAAGNKTIFALAMNVNMYENPVTQENIRKLKELGYGFIEPEVGELACNVSGKGRLAEESAIIEHLDRRLNGKNLLKGKRVLVTAGPTREYLDPVRFISNRSSGKMGYALAAEAIKETAEVLLISGPSFLPVPVGVEYIRTESAKEMEAVLLENAVNVDYLFMAAAVEDLCPLIVSSEKIKKHNMPEMLPLTISPDLLASFRKQNSNACVVGFSVEMADGKERSIEKMNQKQMDYIVWNDPTTAGAGFVTDTNEVTIIARSGGEWFLPKSSKREIAAEIIRIVVDNYTRKS